MSYERIEQLISCISHCAKAMNTWYYPAFNIIESKATLKIKAAARLSEWCNKQLIKELSNGV